MGSKSAPNANLFGAHSAQKGAPNNPEPLKGNHSAQMRAKSAPHLAHEWSSSLFQVGSGKLTGIC